MAEPSPDRVQIVIPARLASTRLPRKMLLADTGRPLIQHTCEAAARSRLAGGVLVATDSEEIAAAVRAFGGQARLTDPHAASGTDRVAEVAAAMPQIDIFVNVQGDEPEIHAATIDAAIGLLSREPMAAIATAVTPIREAESLRNPACVKVALSHAGRALYFSRSPIPFPRDAADDAALRRLLTTDPPVFLKHVGLYAYRREFLLRMRELPPSPLEDLERLEQLRPLQAGAAIFAAVVKEHAAGIDTPADYAAFVRRWSDRHEA